MHFIVIKIGINTTDSNPYNAEQCLIKLFDGPFGPPKTFVLYNIHRLQYS